MKQAVQQHCFHCGLPVPLDGRWRLAVLDAERAFCCAGCLEVSGAIVRAGLEDYYRHRSTTAARADPDVVPEILSKLELYDHPEIQRSFVSERDGQRQASLILEDIRCAACLWLNEQHIRRLDGVSNVEMDYTSQRARVSWDPQRTTLSRILRAIADIGYVAYPYDTRHREQLLRDRKRRDGQRLLFAGLIGMPVMQFAFATYVMGEADVAGQLPLWVIIGRWTVLFATATVLFYAGQDFFVGAWRDLRNRRLGMDVPIVIGLCTAFLGSLVATLRQHGEVYFDSIVMFVFFVLLARFFEMRGRVRAADAMDRLARIVPETTRRLRRDGREEEVAVIELKHGDRLQLRPGEAVPADGEIVDGRSSFDESALTGEAIPVEKGPGEAVFSGTINRDQPVTVQVSRVGAESTAGEIRDLLQRGLHSRPRFALLAERAAEWFVVLVLSVASITAGTWFWLAPGEALANTVAVLIVTCPCALALATPVAVAIGAGRLAEHGILPLRMTAVEALARADTAAFDKTGTLTRGVLELVHMQGAGGYGKDAALVVAAALERRSEHPVARALQRAAPQEDVEVSDYRNLPGCGVVGLVRGRHWKLGKPAFALGGLAEDAEVGDVLSRLQARGLHTVVLSDGEAARGVFAFQDPARTGIETLASELKKLGLKELALLSGDSAVNVRRFAAGAGIPEAKGDLTPGDKLDWIRRKQASGKRVLMVGDGINDAPTLAAADVSVSFADATDLAKSQSDLVILAKDLYALGEARRLAQQTRRIILQNLLWAAGYNVLAVPAAALGLVPPWAAAIGMSVSSLVVVGNALRLRKRSAPVSRSATRGPVLARTRSVSVT
ncbi:MAG: heavy metal translocating P-type ATPase [Gammaproteobacteria bacterium]|nr:heavy metal translocating P-type ATPase [Gammaproteobacteria bacterium]